MAVYTLDTSAVLAYVRGEPGEDEVESILLRSQSDAEERILLPFIVMMEVEYILLRELQYQDVEKNLEIISAWPIEIIESGIPWRRAAASVKSRGRLSLTDSWVAALAIINDANLVHKDPEFDEVDGLKAIRLPYDRDSVGRGQ